MTFLEWILNKLRGDENKDFEQDPAPLTKHPPPPPPVREKEVEEKENKRVVIIDI